MIIFYILIPVTYKYSTKIETKRIFYIYINSLVNQILGK